MTGFEWRDAKGRPCRLIVEVYNGESAGHVATTSDLLAALGQLSPGSDGPPTREDIQSAYDAAYLAAEQAGEQYPHDDAKRSLYNAGRAEGRALGEQKQAARDAELKEAQHRACDAMIERDNAKLELAATKAKLAEVERELASALRVSEGRARQRDELSIAYHRNQTVVEAAKLWAQIADDDGADHRLEQAAVDALFAAVDALASAGTDADRTEAPANPVPLVGLRCPACDAPHVDEGEWAIRHHKTHQCQSCKHEWRPFPYATVGVAYWSTDPDEDEPPRPEAGELRCEYCNMREHVYSKGGRCPLGPSGRHSFDEPTEEPKPEPQPDAPLPFPWRLEFDGTLWSVMSADGQHVADDLREADAALIVARCNPALPPERQPEVERDNGSEQE